MSQPGQPTQDRIAATANRLRLLQVELADQPESARREYLNEVISQSLVGVHPGERAAFIEELKARFPTWDGQVKVEDLSPRGALDEAESRKIDFLLPRFIDAIGRC